MGIPKVMRSDKGSQYSSASFKKFHTYNKQSRIFKTIEDYTGSKVFIGKSQR